MIAAACRGLTVPVAVPSRAWSPHCPPSRPILGMPLFLLSHGEAPSQHRWSAALGCNSCQKRQEALSPGETASMGPSPGGERAFGCTSGCCLLVTHIFLRGPLPAGPSPVFLSRMAVQPFQSPHWGPCSCLFRRDLVSSSLSPKSLIFHLTTSLSPRALDMRPGCALWAALGCFQVPVTRPGVAAEMAGSVLQEPHPQAAPTQAQGAVLTKKMPLSASSPSDPKTKQTSGSKHKLTKAASLPGKNGNPTFAAVAAGYDKSPGEWHGVRRTCHVWATGMEEGLICL